LDVFPAGDAAGNDFSQAVRSLQPGIFEIVTTGESFGEIGKSYVKFRAALR